MNAVAVPPPPPAIFWWVLLVGWLTLGIPTFWDFLFGQWSGYSQGHELLLLSVSGWLMWRQWPSVRALPDQRAGWPTIAGMTLGLLAYGFGRTQELIRVELVSLWWVGLCLLLACKGRAALRRTWFVWLFTLFVIPVPFGLVLVLTAPLKEAVSVVATFVLSGVGYPVGRTGVVITVGQYQLLVAEACAGLHSMFILEAMGLLYSHLVDHQSWWRNGMLAAFAVPVSFLANVTRVMVLIVVTYHFGDEVGQGFVHHFAGVVLFGMALALMFGVDWLLGVLLPRHLRGE
jgi:exosortase B